MCIGWLSIDFVIVPPKNITDLAYIIFQIFTNFKSILKTSLHSEYKNFRCVTINCYACSTNPIIILIPPPTALSFHTYFLDFVCGISKLTVKNRLSF